MTDARDYEKARREYVASSTIPTLDELKILIEATIDSSKDIYISKGYIPIEFPLVKKLYHYNYMDKAIADWLAKYNWEISTNLNETYQLVLAAIKP